MLNDVQQLGNVKFEHYIIPYKILTKRSDFLISHIYYITQ